MATKTLAEMKDKLYEAFDKAFTAYGDLQGSSGGTVADRTAARAQALGTAAQISQAIVTIDHEIMVQDLVKEARERGDSIAVEITGGLTNSVAPMSTIKFKPKA